MRFPMARSLAAFCFLASDSGVLFFQCLWRDLAGRFCIYILEAALFSFCKKAKQGGEKRCSSDGMRTAVMEGNVELITANEAKVDERVRGERRKTFKGSLLRLFSLVSFPCRVPCWFCGPGAYLVDPSMFQSSYRQEPPTSPRGARMPAGGDRSCKCLELSSFSVDPQTTLNCIATHKRNQSR